MTRSARSALGSGPLNRSSTNGAVATPRDATPDVSSTNAWAGVNGCFTGISACSRTATRSISICRRSLTAASLVGAGSMNADCAEPDAFAPNAERSARRPVAYSPGRYSPSPAASSAATSIGTYGAARISVVGCETAARSRANAAPTALLCGCWARCFQAFAVSGPTASDMRNPEARARKVAIRSSRPPGFICATTFGSSEPSGRVIGSAMACNTSATESFFSIGFEVPASTATSQVTNDPDATPVFTS